MGCDGPTLRNSGESGVNFYYGRGHVSISQFRPAERLSEQAARAAFELVAEALRQDS